MTETFTASNGVVVTYIEDGDQIGLTAPAEGGREYKEWTGGRFAQALREFFRAEEDERLGRWRSKVHPDFFVTWVYEGESINICSDKHPAVGSVGIFGRDDAYARETIEWEVAGEFFDAHPEPKPWFEAQAGEFWALTRNGDEFLFEVVDVVFGSPRFKCTEDDPHISTSMPFTAGRRIWPADD